MKRCKSSNISHSHLTADENFNCFKSSPNLAFNLLFYFSYSNDFVVTSHWKMSEFEHNPRAGSPRHPWTPQSHVWLDYEGLTRCPFVRLRHNDLFTSLLHGHVEARARETEECPSQDRGGQSDHLLWRASLPWNTALSTKVSASSVKRVPAPIPVLQETMEVAQKHEVQKQ